MVNTGNISINSNQQAVIVVVLLIYLFLFLEIQYGGAWDSERRAAQEGAYKDEWVELNQGAYLSTKSCFKSRLVLLMHFWKNPI